jgi:coiled-coil domain-containing protein 22
VTCSRVPADVDSFDAVKAEHLVSIVAGAISLITKGEVTPPTRLPPSMGARHRQCTTLAQLVQELGYRKDFTFSQLLYPSNKDTRNLLLWVVERLPRAGDDEADEDAATEPDALLRAKARAAFVAWRSTPTALGVGLRDAFSTAKLASLNVSEAVSVPVGRRESFHSFPLSTPALYGRAGLYANGRQSAVTRQVASSAELAASLLHTDATVLGRAAAIARAGGPAKARTMAATARSTLSTEMRKAFAAACGAGNVCGEEASAAVGGGLVTYDGSMAGASGVGMSLASLLAHIRAGRVDLGRNAFLLAAEFAHDRATMSEGGAGESKAEDASDRAKTEEEIAADRAAELEGLEARAGRAKLAEGALIRETRLAEQRLLALLDRLEKAKAQLSTDTAELELQKAALAMVEADPEGSVAKLEADVAAKRERLLELNKEWEAHRAPLVDSIWLLKSRAQRAEARARELEEETTRLRDEMRPLAEAVKAREAEALSLHERAGRIPKDAPSRQEYVGRIMAIVEQARKQEREEQGIIRDISAVQAEIARITDILGRTTKATEELVYAEVKAKSSSAAHVQSFQNVVGLREAFSAVYDAIHDTARADAELRDLEIRAEQMKQRAAARNRDQLQRDLDMVSVYARLLPSDGVLCALWLRECRVAPCAEGARALIFNRIACGRRDGCKDTEGTVRDRVVLTCGCDVAASRRERRSQEGPRRRRYFSARVGVLTQLNITDAPQPNARCPCSFQTPPSPSCAHKGHVKRQWGHHRP